MHSCRMLTARLLAVSPSMHCSGGWVLLLGGVSTARGYCSMHWGRLPCGQNDRHVQKHNLRKLRLRAVKNLRGSSIHDHKQLTL